MFPLLHERTRRRLCRWLFLLLAMLPTGAVLAWAAAINGQSHQTAVCDEISAVLGLDVRAIHVSHPRPEATLLEGFEIVDPETAEVLFRSKHVELREDGQSTYINATQPELKLASRNWWRPIVEQRLLLRNERQKPLQLRAAELKLIWPSGNLLLSDCSADFRSLDDANIATARFQLAEQPAAEPIQLEFRRTSSSGRPNWWFGLETGANLLPCAILATVMEFENPFGTACEFRGTIQGSRISKVWTTVVTDGTLEQADLHSLARRHFPGQFNGTAQIVLHHAQFEGDRPNELHGVIKTGPNVASRTTLEAIANYLGLPRLLPSTADVPYDELAAEFKLAEAGLTILGRCEGAPGIILKSQNDAIFGQPAETLRLWWR